MIQNKKLNNKTDESGVTFANYFYNNKKQPLTAAQTTDLLNYVKRLATNHAYKRYYYGDLSNPPQPEYIDDLTQYALLSLYSGYTTRYKKLVGGEKTVITTLQDCKVTISKTTKTEKQLTDLQAFRRFIYISFNDYNYNERSTTATIGNRKAIPLELTADSNTDEMVYITDMSDFAKWTESELNDLHALSLTQNELNIINMVFNEKLTKKEFAFLTYHINHPCNNRRQNAYAFNKQLREKNERELNTYDLIEKKLKPALKKELKKQGITSGLLVYLLFD